MTTDAVTTERRDAGVLVCHVDDGKANALSLDIITAITSAVDDAEADDDITSMVLHGREGKFSAGFDLNVMRSGDLAAMSELVSSGGELVARLYGSDVPVVAACTGLDGGKRPAGGAAHHARGDLRCGIRSRAGLHGGHQAVGTAPAERSAAICACIASSVSPRNFRTVPR